MGKSRKLTRLQKRFAARVVSGVKPTQAIRELRPDLARPDVKASKLMALTPVQEYIDKLDQAALATAGITRTQIVQELGKIAFCDPRRILNDRGAMKPFSELDDASAGAIAGIDVEELYAGRGDEREQIGVVRKVKLWNKREALAELAVIAGLKREQSGQGAPVGPGLTVIVQQGVQVHGQPTVQTHQVQVNLPRPA